MPLAKCFLEGFAKTDVIGIINARRNKRLNPLRTMLFLNIDILDPRTIPIGVPKHSRIKARKVPWNHGKELDFQ
jgi:hypothetical protein